jgi:hypothetical protein
VLRECHADGKPSRRHCDTSPDLVESQAENGAVRRVRGEPDRAPVAAACQGLAKHCDVAVIAAERTLVEGLLERPDSCRRRAGGRRSHSLTHGMDSFQDR